MKNLFYIAAVVAVLSMSVVLAKPGKEDHGREGHGMPPPPFLRNATEEARKEFFDIMRNKNETITAQKAAINQWATKYDLTTEVNDFNTKTAEKKEEMKQNLTTLIGELPQAQTELEQIFSNEDQTPEQMKQAVEEYRQQNPELFEALMCLKRSMEGPGGPGGPGGPRGGPGGPRGGSGGPRGGPESPHGGPRGFGGPGGQSGEDSRGMSNEEEEFGGPGKRFGGF